MRTIEGKTAALMSTSCRIGALTGGLPRAEVDVLTDFGRCFGMLFQMRDDVLDVVASDEELGKPAGQDLAEGIYTLPVLRALADPGTAPSSARCSACVSTRPSATRPGPSWPGRAIADTVAAGHSFVEEAVEAAGAIVERLPGALAGGRGAVAARGTSCLSVGPAQPSRRRLNARDTHSTIGATTGRLGAQGGEGDDLADVGHVGQQHDQAVDADAESAGRRQPVLESAEVVLVDRHGLVVAAGRAAACASNRARWSSGSTSSENAFPELAPGDDGFEALHEIRVDRWRRASGDTSAG